jgi:hypothetical protein
MKNSYTNAESADRWHGFKVLKFRNFVLGLVKLFQLWEVGQVFYYLDFVASELEHP